MPCPAYFGSGAWASVPVPSVVAVAVVDAPDELVVAVAWRSSDELASSHLALFTMAVSVLTWCVRAW